MQRNALRVWEKKTDFLSEIKKDPEITAHLSAEDIDRICSWQKRLKHMDIIFERLGIG